MELLMQIKDRINMVAKDYFLVKLAKIIKIKTIINTIKRNQKYKTL